MPCFRCSTRQTDPARGASPWRRAVVGGDQVLVCPACQATGVDEHLDRCGTCGSVRLVKALGEVTCRACGATTTTQLAASSGDEDGNDGGGAGRRRPEGLSDEIAAAVARVLGRSSSTGGDGSGRDPV